MAMLQFSVFPIMQIVPYNQTIPFTEQSILQEDIEHMSKNIATPFRYDFVGSFLRPEELKDARRSFEAGTISAEELKAIEDRCILDLIEKQKKAGYHVLTDGEFRRATWHLDFMWGFAGIDHKPTKTGLPFQGEAAMIDDTFLTGKVTYRGTHPFLDHFRFVQAQEDENTVAKLTIPAPAQFLEQFDMPFAKENVHQFYESTEAFEADLVAAYIAFINDLYAAGCRNLQLDDCSWGLLVDPRRHTFFGTDDKGIDVIRERYLNINNAVLAAAPKELVINTHVCRGNFHSTYAATGGYDGIARYLFSRENVNAYYLEYDSDRSGGFAPLKEITGDKKVVLGLITTKSPELEDKEKVIARIREAANYISLDRLYLSPQCGFASCEIGNKLTEEEQWAKLALVKEIAKEVWG